MKKYIFLSLLIFIFFSCLNSIDSKKDLNQWLLSIIDRDLENNFKIQKNEKNSNSILLKNLLEENVNLSKPLERGLQLFHNNQIGVGFYKNRNSINFISLFDIIKETELLNNNNTSIFRISLLRGKDTIKLNNESSWKSVNLQWREDDNPILSLFFSDPLDIKLKGITVIGEVNLSIILQIGH